MKILFEVNETIVFEWKYVTLKIRIYYTVTYHVHEKTFQIC